MSAETSGMSGREEREVWVEDGGWSWRRRCEEWEHQEKVLSRGG